MQTKYTNQTRNGHGYARCWLVSGYIAICNTAGLFPSKEMDDHFFSTMEKYGVSGGPTSTRKHRGRKKTSSIPLLQRYFKETYGFTPKARLVRTKSKNFRQRLKRGTIGVVSMTFSNDISSDIRDGEINQNYNEGIGHSVCLRLNKGQYEIINSRDDVESRKSLHKVSKEWINHGKNIRNNDTIFWYVRKKRSFIL